MLFTSRTVFLPMALSALQNDLKSCSPTKYCAACCMASTSNTPFTHQANERINSGGTHPQTMR